MAVTYSPTGVINYGSVEDQIARQKAQQTQQPYDASAPSAGTVSQVGSQYQNSPYDVRISPTGDVGLTNQSEQERRMLQFKAQLDAQNRDAFLSKLSGSGATSPKVPARSIGSDENAARAAAFARAKEQAGNIARSSLTAITENMANRGISGSGIEALKGAGAMTEAAAPLQELTRDQLMADLNRAADVSDMSYQGAIEQRGQDLGSRTSYLNLLRSLY